MDIDAYRLIVGWPTAVASLTIVALLAYALRDPWLRSWRTVLGAALAIAVIVASLVAPAAPRGIIRAAAIGIYALAVLFEYRWLRSLRRADGEFAQAYRTALSKFQTLKRRIGSIPSGEYGVEFAAITNELAALQAPSEDWRQLLDETVADLSSRLTRLRLEVLPSDDEKRQMENRWEATQAQVRHLFDAKRRFWLPWP